MQDKYPLCVNVVFDIFVLIATVDEYKFEVVKRNFSNQIISWWSTIFFKAIELILNSL